jgi:hypothetical protein
MVEKKQHGTPIWQPQYQYGSLNTNMAIAALRA